VAELKQKRIIEAAKKLFHEEGFDSVSMRKIAADVGMGVMTLYKYFANKNAILHHIWDEFIVELFVGLQEKVLAENTHNDKFRVACYEYLNYWFKHPDRFRMVFLNEDRAESESSFFINHADIEVRMKKVFFPLTQLIFVGKSDGQLLKIIQGVICHMNGIALNLITISEYQWPGHECLLDAYLDLLIES
jgi:AcrR family transcriptional regulator